MLNHKQMILHLRNSNLLNNKNKNFLKIKKIRNKTILKLTIQNLNLNNHQLLTKP